MEGKSSLGGAKGQHCISEENCNTFVGKRTYIYLSHFLVTLQIYQQIYPTQSLTFTSLNEPQLRLAFVWVMFTISSPTTHQPRAFGYPADLLVATFWLQNAISINKLEQLLSGAESFHLKMKLSVLDLVKATVLPSPTSAFVEESM